MMMGCFDGGINGDKSVDWDIDLKNRVVDYEVDGSPY